MQDPNEDMQSQKIGKRMLFLAWIAGLLLLTLWFDDLLSERFNPNQRPESLSVGNATEVRLKQNRMGHYVTTGLINGKPVVFLLDTGATDVSIPANLASRLGLGRGYPSQVNTANGVITVYNTRINTLQIGDIVLRDIAGNLNPGMSGEEILLGMSALKQLEFTQKDGWLILRSY